MGSHGLYDDPKMINAFLADMRWTAEDAADSVDHTENTISPQIPQSKSQGDEDMSAVPPLGIRAPPPTPETRATAISAIKHLPSIDEDNDGTRSSNGTVFQQTEASPPFDATVAPFHPFTTKVDLAAAVIARQLATENKPASGVHDEQVRMYHENALQKFREEAHARVASRGSIGWGARSIDEQLVSKTESLAIMDDNRGILQVTEDGDFAKPSDNDHSFHASSSVSTGIIRDAQDDATAISSDESDSNSSIDIIVDAPRSPDSFKSVKSIIAITAPSSTTVSKDSPLEHCEEDLDTTKSKSEKDTIVKDEPREDAIYFPTWGAPSSRPRGPARVRKVVVYQLPATSDFTLIQSLIHGGAIEVMTMTPPHNGTVNAFVTFTTADACNSYYQKYPNGLEFKHVGKKCTVFIQLGMDVDVVSGVLQSSLDCGASRVIKVAGADHDWSMKALHKIAGGKDNRRKVEAILDNYRNDSRTIVFRFTKIADAVTLRGELLRDPDWQDTDIQFGVDPCEKATGVHFE